MFQAHSKSPIVGKVGEQGGQGSLVTEAGGGGCWGRKKEWRAGKMTFLCISSSLQSTCELSFGYLLRPLFCFQISKDLPIVASFPLLPFRCQYFQMYLPVLNIHKILLRRKKNLLTALIKVYSER